MADRPLNIHWPDTCDCGIEYTWDPALSEADRVHVPVSVPNVCAAHRSLMASSILKAASAAAAERAGAPNAKLLRADADQALAADVRDVHDAVNAENRSKNHALAAVVEHAPALTVLVQPGDNVVAHDGTDLGRIVRANFEPPAPTLVLHPEIRVTWEYRGDGKNRSLTFRLEGAHVTADEKARIDAAAASLEVPTVVDVLVL